MAELAGYWCGNPQNSCRLIVIAILALLVEEKRLLGKDLAEKNGESIGQLTELLDQSVDEPTKTLDRNQMTFLAHSLYKNSVDFAGWQNLIKDLRLALPDLNEQQCIQLFHAYASGAQPAYDQLLRFARQLVAGNPAPDPT